MLEREKEIRPTGEQVLEKQREEGSSDGILGTIWQNLAPPNPSEDNVPTTPGELVEQLAGPANHAPNDLPGRGPLSWGGGEHHVSGSLTGDLAVASGIGSFQSHPVTPPSDFGRPVHTVPRCTQSRSGEHMNTEQILNQGRSK